MARKRRKPSIETTGVRSHIVVELLEGWAYDARKRRFENDQEVFSPKEDLPKYTRIAYRVPSLQKKAKLSEPEKHLARCIQIVPVDSTSIEELVDLISLWPCVEKAWAGASVSPAKRPGMPKKRKGS